MTRRLEALLGSRSHSEANSLKQDFRCALRFFSSLLWTSRMLGREPPGRVSGSLTGGGISGVALELGLKESEKEKIECPPCFEA